MNKSIHFSSTPGSAQLLLDTSDSDTSPPSLRTAQILRVALSRAQTRTRHVILSSHLPRVTSRGQVTSFPERGIYLHTIQAMTSS